MYGLHILYQSMNVQQRPYSSTAQQGVYMNAIAAQATYQNTSSQQGTYHYWLQFVNFCNHTFLSDS